MRYKTLFRLWLRVLGVYFVVAGSSGLMMNVVNIYRQLDGGVSWDAQLQSGLPRLFMILAGLYLFFGGRWITDRAVPSNRPYCPECGYEISHMGGEDCPECGTRIAQAGNDDPGESTRPS